MSLRLDIGPAPRRLIQAVAASPLTPRVVRYVIYRALGFDFETPDIGSSQSLLTDKVKLGSQTTVGPECYFAGYATIDIGRRCMIGPRCIFTTSSHGWDPAARAISRRSIDHDIVVGDGAWIGAGAILIGGATVGAGAVVGAGSVITGHCEPGMIYVGVPARKIGRTSALPLAEEVAAQVAGQPVTPPD
jgi:acetyltransferase-like isoleucine patch superfamily enzyme